MTTHSAPQPILFKLTLAITNYPSAALFTRYSECIRVVRQDVRQGQLLLFRPLRSGHVYTGNNWPPLPHPYPYPQIMPSKAPNIDSPITGLLPASTSNISRTTLMQRLCRLYASPLPAFVPPSNTF